MTAVKKCTKCGTEKSLSDFYIVSKKTGVYRAACKVCHNENLTPRTPEQQKKASKRWRDKKVWTEEEREKVRINSAEWYSKNGDAANKRKREKHRKNPEHIRKQQRDWDAKNIDKKMFTAAKFRAKKNGLEFTIVLADLFPLPTNCPILGIHLRKGKRTHDPNGYSLDRIDNTKGYTKMNIAIMSRRANVLKSDGTSEEFHAIADFIDFTLSGGDVFSLVDHVPYPEDTSQSASDIHDRDGRHSDPEHRHRLRREWESKNVHRKLFTEAKGRAKKRRIEFTITLDDILPLPTHCPALGIPLKRCEGGVNDHHSFTLDRVDNTKGYTKDNVAVISFRANKLKSDGTAKEMRAIGDFISSHPKP